MKNVLKTQSVSLVKIVGAFAAITAASCFAKEAPKTAQPMPSKAPTLLEIFEKTSGKKLPADKNVRVNSKESKPKEKSSSPAKYSVPELQKLLESAGNGEGYNGPSTAGESIPVAMDRNVTLNHVKAATLKCQIKLIEQIGAVILKKPDLTVTPPRESIAFTDNLDFLNPPQNRGNNSLFISTYVDAYIKIDSGSYQVNFNLRGQNDKNVPGRDGKTFLDIFGLKSEDGASKYYGYEIEGRPNLVANDIIRADASFDEYGEEVDGNFAVKGLALQFPDDYAPRKPLTNKKSKRQIAVEANWAGYAGCLLSEIYQ